MIFAFGSYIRQPIRTPVRMWASYCTSMYSLPFLSLRLVSVRRAAAELSESKDSMVTTASAPYCAQMRSTSDHSRGAGRLTPTLLPVISMPVFFTEKRGVRVSAADSPRTASARLWRSWPMASPVSTPSNTFSQPLDGLLRSTTATAAMCSGIFICAGWSTVRLVWRLQLANKNKRGNQPRIFALKKQVLNIKT